MKDWKEIAKEIFPEEYKNFIKKFSGRNPNVTLGVTIEDDVKRRDLTYNALFFDLDTNEIVDLTGGRKDLEDGITRMVGDPFERFDEDSLRILRAFRFASRYNHPLDKDTEEAIIKRGKLQNIDPETGDMKRISQERIWEEMIKAKKQAKDYNYYLSLFTKYNMWGEVFPGVKINTKQVLSKNFIILITNLFLDNSTDKLEVKLVQDFKIDGETAKKVVFLLELLNLTPEVVLDTYRKKTSCSIDDSTILEWLEVTGNESNTLIKFLEYRPTVSSQDLMDQGFKGRDLGIKIKELEIEKFKNML